MRCGNGVGFVIAAERYCLGSRQRCRKGVISAAHDVVLGLSFGQTISSSAKEASQVHVRILLDPVFLLEIPCPELPACPELRHLFPEVTEYVEVEGKATDKCVYVIAPGDHVVYIRVRDQYGVPDLLCRRCARLPDMVTAYAHRVRARESLYGVFDRVADQLYRRFYRKDPGAPSDHLLQNIILWSGRNC